MNILKNGSIFLLSYGASVYPIYTYKPIMNFNDYFTSVGGLFGLWKGLSLIDIKNKFTAFKKIIKMGSNITKFKKLLLKSLLYFGNKIKVKNE
jgi:hypothetical protein